MRLKGRRREAERGVSRGRSSGREAESGCNFIFGSLSDAKDQTERRAKRTVGLEGKGSQMSRRLELPQAGTGEARRGMRSVEVPAATHENERSGASDLMERVCERANLQAALKRVRKNKGSAGIDGMTVDELPEHLKTHWPALREQLLSGTYQPSAVRK